MRVDGKVVAVTGGARGIGLAIATALQKSGAKVATGDIDEAAVTASEARLGLTVDALAEIGAEAIIPAHCTGWRAAQALAQAMPQAYMPNSVGSRLELHNGQTT